MTSEDPRTSERERREAAEAAAEQGVDPGAREVPGRAIKQMVSVRFEPELVGALRRIADSRGIGVSDLLREAAAQLIEDADRQQVHLHLFRTSDSTVPWSPMLAAKVNLSYFDGQSTRYDDVPAIAAS